MRASFFVLPAIVTAIACLAAGCESPTQTDTTILGVQNPEPRGDEALTMLLSRHVSPSGAVDYEGLSHDRPLLAGYLEHLERLDLDAKSRNERLATMLNAYNAFTLALMLENPGVESIRDISSEERWKATRWNLGGETLSLDELEHDRIREDFDEPNIHFALVCAADSCPPLRQEAYTGAELEDQLESQARRVHASDKWFEYDPSANTVRLTKLYEWYMDDFAEAGQDGDRAVLEHAAKYDPALRRALDSGRDPDIEWIEYDWSLNTKNSKGWTSP